MQIGLDNLSGSPVLAESREGVKNETDNEKIGNMESVHGGQGMV